MKRLIIISFIITLSLTLKTNAEPVIGDGGYGYFYSSLAPYGTWIQLNDGMTVWRPLHMRIGWAPYKYGRWMWTNDGWYWDSDEPFGYIVFHYGRWYYDDYYGWIWVPDDVWAPAWVEWRYDNDYIGWAPLPPYASFSISFGIRFTTGYTTPYNYWHFVPYRYMCNSHVYNYYINDHYKYRIFSRTKYRTNYGYSDGRVINRGVDVDYVKKRSGARIVERNIERVNSPGDLTNSRDRNSGALRAVIIPKDQINRGNDRNVDIRLGNRASSMDINRINIGKAGRVVRENDRNSRPLPGVQRGNMVPENRDRNPQIERRTEPNNRNGNPFLKNRENNRPQSVPRIEKQNRPERIAPQRPQRNTRPEVRRENTRRSAPQPRNNSRENRNEKRTSNSRRGR